EAFYAELKVVAQLMEPPVAVPVGSPYGLQEALGSGPPLPPRITGQLSPPLYRPEPAQAGLAAGGYYPRTSAAMFTGELSPAAPTLPEVSMKLAAARQG